MNGMHTIAWNGYVIVLVYPMLLVLMVIVNLHTVMILIQPDVLT